MFYFSFILISVLVSVVLFSLEGEEEDHNLPTGSQCGFIVISAFNGSYNFLFKIATKAHFIFHVRRLKSLLY